MNKRAQMNVDWGELIKLIIFLPILLAIIGALYAVISSANQPNCPTCEDCSIYKQNASQLYANLTTCLNQSKQIIYINQTQIVYVNQTKEIPVMVYKDKWFPSTTIISISFVLSLLLTITLFKINIHLPKEIEEKLKKIEKWIIRVKWISFALSIIILIRLIIAVFSLF